MRPSFSTQGIVLARTDFNEADRILTFLTPDRGKLKAMAKGVRKAKAKLAGSIELFSISDITVIPGRGDISTLISARLVKHYGSIVKEIDRTEAAYQFLKMLDKATEDQPEPAYFDLLKKALRALNDLNSNTTIVEAWYKAQLIKLTGHAPNLEVDKEGRPLKADQKYQFDYESMGFQLATSNSGFNTQQIKFLRLLFGDRLPLTIGKIENADKLLKACLPIIDFFTREYISG